MMVVYDFDSNAILAEPIKNRQVVTICDAFLRMHKILKPRGSFSEVYIIGNECYIELKEVTKK